jgi:hypothetical protein
MMSAQSGDGVEAWLDFCLQDQPAGKKITEVDYDTYAEGEAALGWLNASVILRAGGPIDWKAFAADLLAAFRESFRARSAEIAHLKIHLSAGGERLVGNLTDNASEPSIRGALASSQLGTTLLINARVHLDPESLQEIVERDLHSIAANRVAVTIATMQSFRPGRPQPTHRLEKVL